MNGMVEIVTRNFVAGWAAVEPGQHNWLFAELNGKFVGAGRADLSRPDLVNMPRPMFAFVIVFEEPLSADDDPAALVVCHADSRKALSSSLRIKVDLRDPMQVFVFGSPRSGTSEISSVLAKTLSLAWLGEGHIAGNFSEAARILRGDTANSGGAAKFSSLAGYERPIYDATLKAYFFLHGSHCFIDKTPSIQMINAAPFLARCFPEAKFIFMRRNAVANVLSRLKKFGGSFESHCKDWAAAMDAWMNIRASLPHFIELEQEVMADSPIAVADEVMAYLGRPDLSGAVTNALSTSKLEHTGAGTGRTRLNETDWTAAQVAQFRTHCDPTRARWGYALD